MEESVNCPNCGQDLEDLSEDEIVELIRELARSIGCRVELF